MKPIVMSKRAFVRLLIIIALIFATLGAMASEQGDAEKAAARGWAALEESNSDPARSVDAALAFAEALPYYRAAGDEETCREIQANIFWCKKRMNEDDLASYLAAKGHESAPALIKVVDEVVDATIEPSEADKYFANAEAFAKKHPTDHLKIAIRYFEVASRFPGTQVSLDAQQRSLAAQGKAKIKATKPVAKVEPKPATPKYKDETQKGKFVVLFSEPNFKGTKVMVRIPTAITECWQLKFPNDGLRSIQVPKDASVNLYTSDLGGGTKTVVTETMAEITSVDILGTTSLSVEKAP